MMMQAHPGFPAAAHTATPSNSQVASMRGGGTPSKLRKTNPMHSAGAALYAQSDGRPAQAGHSGSTVPASVAASSILTSVVANYVINAVPVLMHNVFGPLTHDHVAQMLPTLVSSSGLVAVYQGTEIETSDKRKALELLELTKKKYPNIIIPTELQDSVKNDMPQARCEPRICCMEGQRVLPLPNSIAMTRLGYLASVVTFVTIQ
jgi:hypothetical protein